MALKVIAALGSSLFTLCGVKIKTMGTTGLTRLWEAAAGGYWVCVDRVYTHARTTLKVPVRGRVPYQPIAASRNSFESPSCAEYSAATVIAI